MCALPARMICCSKQILTKSLFSKYCKTPILRNYWRRSIFSDLSSAMHNVESRMRDMDREMNRLFDDFQRASPVKIPRLFPTIDLSRAREIPVVTTDKDGRTFRVDLDMQGVEPENINVTLKNDELTITARKDEKRSDGSRFVSEQQFHYNLPKEVNPDSVRSSLTDGILSIEAPLPKLESKEIPIKIESAANSDKSSQ